MPWAKNLDLSCKTLPAQTPHVRNTQYGSLTHDLINGQLRMIDSSYEVRRMCSLLHSLKVIHKRQPNYGINFHILFHQRFVCVSLSDSVQIFFLFIVSVLAYVVPSSVSFTIEILRLFMLIE